MHEVVVAPQTYDIVTFTGDDVVLRHDGSAPEVVRAKILDLVASMLEATGGGPGVEMRVEHEWVDGMYFRKLYIPRGTLLAGKIHKLACMNVVALGDITVLTEFGCRRITAGATAVSKPGTIKVGYAHEDTIFINAFRTDETDLEKTETAIATTDAGLIGMNEEFVCL